MQAQNTGAGNWSLFLRQQPPDITQYKHAQLYVTTFALICTQEDIEFKILQKFEDVGDYKTHHDAHFRAIFHLVLHCFITWSEWANCCEKLSRFTTRRDGFFLGCCLSFLPLQTNKMTFAKLIVSLLLNNLLVAPNSSSNLILSKDIRIKRCCGLVNWFLVVYVYCWLEGKWKRQGRQGRFWPIWTTFE